MAVAETELKKITKTRGKRYAASVKAIGDKRDRALTIDEAFELLDKTQKAKFDETVDIAIRLAVDPKQADQMVRGAVTLPNGLGKKITIAVFAKGAKADEAKAAGADFVGDQDLLDKINGGWMDFNAVVATPDMMGLVSRLGRVLGPRGLMPNPKLGTVTMDLAKVVDELKKGRVEFRVEKAGILHVSIGKLSAGKEKLKENFNAVIEQILKAKPTSIKGTYIRSAYLSSAMGPSLQLSESSLSS